MKLGRVHILHPEELVDALESINIIQDAFMLRRNELSGTLSMTSFLCAG